MPEYVVAWTQLVDAESPKEAAFEAAAIFKKEEEPGDVEVFLNEEGADRDGTRIDLTEGS